MITRVQQPAQRSQGRNAGTRLVSGDCRLGRLHPSGQFLLSQRGRLPGLAQQQSRAHIASIYKLLWSVSGAGPEICREHGRTGPQRAVAMRAIGHRIDHGLSQTGLPAFWACTSPRSPGWRQGPRTIASRRAPVWFDAIHGEHRQCSGVIATCAVPPGTGGRGGAPGASPAQLFRRPGSLRSGHHNGPQMSAITLRNAINVRNGHTDPLALHECLFCGERPAGRSNVDDLRDHIQRTIAGDPALAVGSARELIEGTGGVAAGRGVRRADADVVFGGRRAHRDRDPSR